MLHRPVESAGGSGLRVGRGGVGIKLLLRDEYRQLLQRFDREQNPQKWRSGVAKSVVNL
jgi:hypothetical protein